MIGSELLQQCIAKERDKGAPEARLEKILLGARVLLNVDDEVVQSLSVFDKAQGLSFLIPFLFQNLTLPRAWLNQAILSWGKLQDQVFMQAFTNDKPLHDLTEISYATLIETDPFEPLLQLNAEAFPRPASLEGTGWLENAFLDLKNWPEGFSCNAQSGLRALMADSKAVDGISGWKITYAALIFLRSHLFDKGLPENGRLTVPLFGLPDLECYGYWHTLLSLTQKAMQSCAEHRPSSKPDAFYQPTSSQASLLTPTP